MRELADESHPVTWDVKRMLLVFFISFLFQIIRYIMKCVGDTFFLRYGRVVWIVGIAVIIYGLLDTMIEKRLDLELFYAKSGMAINASVVCGMGIVLVADGFLQTLFWSIGVAFCIGAESYIIDLLRYKKRKRYIGKTGIATTDINYKGKGKFGEETLKVRVTHGSIDQSSTIIITDVDGFNLVVEAKGFRKL